MGPSVGAAPVGSSLQAIESIAKHKSNRELLFWMFRFLAPVKPLVFLACFYLAAAVGIEQLAVLQSGNVVDHISQLRGTGVMFKTDGDKIKKFYLVNS